MSDKRVFVISGGSKGIGRECAKKFAASGFKVYNLSRTPSGEGGVVDISCDVTSEDSVREALAKIHAEEGRIDLVLANAGFGISGAVEFTESKDAHRQFEVNFFGAFDLVKNSLPYLRETKGKVMAVSSAAAIFSIPFQSFYSASKSALASLMCATANEVKNFGIQAGYVQLGDVKTSFTASRQKDHKGDDVYGGVISRSVEKMERDEQGGMPPETIANKVYKLMTKKKMPLKTTVGASYKLLVFLSRILPLSFQNFVIGKLYMK
ncbi:MAG: SDR family NAD(P)-dependent oxidoreductase [Clostridia bacterium]|nr:SDR family NAD(P)-dependent oxidoreductase [Clostridia bacterium]